MLPRQAERCFRIQHLDALKQVTANKIGAAVTRLKLLIAGFMETTLQLNSAPPLADYCLPNP
jgi:hypothetical protein